MSVTSLAFFGFLAATLIIYYIVPKSWQWCVLLGGSLFFFAYTSKWLTLYMLAVTAVVYIAAVVIQNFGGTKSSQKINKAQAKGNIDCCRCCLRCFARRA